MSMIQIAFTSDSSDYISEPTVAKAFAAANAYREGIDEERVGSEHIWKLLNELPSEVQGQGKFLALCEMVETKLEQRTLEPSSDSSNGTYAYFAEESAVPAIADWLYGAVLSASIKLLSK